MVNNWFKKIDILPGNESGKLVAGLMVHPVVPMRYADVLVKT